MQVTFERSEEVARNTHTYWFQSEKPLRYQAGQFVELRLSATVLQGEAGRRWFTLSSSPTEPLLAVTTRITDSPFKRALTSLQPGAQLAVSEPMGDFVLPRNRKKQLFFIVGGIGVTPMRSMLKYLEDSGEQRPITCLYASRDRSDVLFLDLLQRGTKELKLLLDSDGQRLTPEAILAQASSMTSPLIYLSGPEPMLQKLTSELGKHYDQRQLITDYFPGYQRL